MRRFCLDPAAALTLLTWRLIAVGVYLTPAVIGLPILAFGFIAIAFRYARLYCFSDQPSALNFELRLDHLIFEGMSQAEPELLTDPHYVPIVGQDVRRQPRQFLVRSDDQQPRQQFLAQTLAVIAVANQHRHLGVVCAVDLRQPPHPEDLALARGRIHMLRD